MLEKKNCKQVNWFSNPDVSVPISCSSQFEKMKLCYDCRKFKVKLSCFWMFLYVFICLKTYILFIWIRNWNFQLLLQRDILLLNNCFIRLGDVFSRYGGLHMKRFEFLLPKNANVVKFFLVYFRYFASISYWKSNKSYYCCTQKNLNYYLRLFI